MTSTRQTTTGRILRACSQSAGWLQNLFKMESSLHHLMSGNTVHFVFLLYHFVCVGCDIYSIGHYPRQRQSRARVFTAVCLFVCLSVFPHNISKPDSVNFTKLDIRIFYHESWKPICFERSRVKVTSHANIAGVVQYTLVSAVFF